MKKTIALKINVTNIDKNRLYKGKKGTYLDAILHFDDVQDKYDNNGMIVQSVSKEERDNGVKGEILGNAKLLWSEESNPPKEDKPVPNDYDGMTDMMDDGLPF